MGSVFSLFGWGSGSKISPEDELGPDADTPNPDTGLTPRNVYHINKTWDLVRPNMREHGLGFFLLSFKTSPAVQSRFTPFKGVPLEDLKKSKRMAAHGTTVMSAIDSYIQNLDDPSCVVEMLQTTGLNHKHRGVQKSDFDVLPDVFMKYLSDSLGSNWTIEAETAWKKLLGVVVKVMVDQI